MSGIFIIALLIGFYYEYGKGKPFQGFLHFILKYILGFCIWIITGYTLLIQLGIWVVPIIPIILTLYTLIANRSNPRLIQTIEEKTKDHLLEE